MTDEEIISDLSCMSSGKCDLSQLFHFRDCGRDFVRGISGKKYPMWEETKYFLEEHPKYGKRMVLRVVEKGISRLLGLAKRRLGDGVYYYTTDDETYYYCVSLSNGVDGYKKYTGETPKTLTATINF